MKDVKCQNCGALFGKESNEVLTIKNRDLYRYIDKGRVWGPCRGCGNVVEWQKQPKDIA